MSSSNSNLESLGYDLVTALTQNSMNATMKRYLSTINQDIEPACYVYTDTSLTAVKTIPYQDILAATGGVDPFAIPTDITSSSTPEEVGAAVREGGYPFPPDTDSNSTDAEIGQIILDGMAVLTTPPPPDGTGILFAYAFGASMGLPANAPDILTLQDGNSSQRVWYDMYFKTFQIVQLTFGFYSWSYSNIAQDPNDPWVYKWEVGLSLNSADFDSLDQTTQDSIKNLDSSTMFSVEQLLLDLNSAPTYASEQPQYNTVFDDTTGLQTFLKNYWTVLQDEEDVIFSQAIKPENSEPNPTEPSLIPTDLDFIVSQYTDHDGNLSQDQINGLATLNYLVMADNNDFPNPVVAPSWNWLSSSEDQQSDGVMSVRKGEFVKYLKNILDPILNDIAIQPTMDMDLDGMYIYYHWGHKTPDPKPEFSIVNNVNNPTHVLSSYYKSNDDDDKDNPGYDIIAVWGDTLVWSCVQSDVYISGTTIEVVTTASVYLDVGLAGILGVDLSHTKGYIYANKNTATFTMSISQDGELQVDMSKKNQDLTQSSDKDGAYYDGDLDASFFADMITLGDIQDLVDSMVSYYSGHMDSYLNNYDNDINNLLNNVNAWVFPGAETFLYSKCSFSDNQDFTTLIKYADVS